MTERAKFAVEADPGDGICRLAGLARGNLSSILFQGGIERRGRGFFEIDGTASAGISVRMRARENRALSSRLSEKMQSRWPRCSAAQCTGAREAEERGAGLRALAFG